MVLGGPGGFRKAREAAGMNFLQISSRYDSMAPSYDPKTGLIEGLGPFERMFKGLKGLRWL